MFFTALPHSRARRLPPQANILVLTLVLSYLFSIHSESKQASTEMNSISFLVFFETKRTGEGERLAERQRWFPVLSTEQHCGIIAQLKLVWTPLGTRRAKFDFKAVSLNFKTPTKI